MIVAPSQVKGFVMRNILIFSLLLLGLHASAQDRVFTRSGTIIFSSDTPLEKIEATNNKGTCAIDLKTGRVQFAVLIKGFAFRKALMEEHFNENYMESSKHPKATFSGQFVDFDRYKIEGGHEAQMELSGEFTIHGVSQTRTVQVSFKPSEQGVVATCMFNVKPEDHDIKIPGVVRDNIAQEIQVTISTTLQKM